MMLVLLNRPSNVRGKKKEPLNVIKVWLHVMLALPNVMMELSLVRKEIRVQLNEVKVQSYVMLVLPNVTIELSNVREKN